MEIRALGMEYEIDDRTEYGIDASIEKIVADNIRMEVLNNYSSAWTNFEIALHAIDHGKELSLLLDHIRENVGVHIVGIWGIDDHNNDEEYILIAFDRGYGKTIEFHAYDGDIRECAKTFLVDGYPTEEEIEKMYEEYIANYGEVLDAKYTNGAV